MDKEAILKKTKTIIHEITIDDVAKFKGNIVHKVCSTFALAREMEWSSRQFMFDLCSEDEEGVGTMIHIDHKSPAFIGESLIITAKAIKFAENELTCECEAIVNDRTIATGITRQKIMKKSKIERIFSNFDSDEQEG